MISSKKGTWNAYPPLEHPPTSPENWWLVQMDSFPFKHFKHFVPPLVTKGFPNLDNPEAEVEAKQAALEGRDAMILKVPEAPTPEPSGTWIGS